MYARQTFFLPNVIESLCDKELVAYLSHETCTKLGELILHGCGGRLQADKGFSASLNDAKMDYKVYLGP